MSFLQNLLNFVIAKYLKQQVDDDLSFCVDESSPWGISITGDKKIYLDTWSKANKLLPPLEKCLVDFNQKVIFTI